MKAEELPYQADVGAAREFQTLEMIFSTKLGGKHLSEGFYPCAAGVDERAIDIK